MKLIIKPKNRTTPYQIKIDVVKDTFYDVSYTLSFEHKYMFFMIQLTCTRCWKKYTHSL